MCCIDLGFLSAGVGRNIRVVNSELPLDWCYEKASLYHAFLVFVQLLFRDYQTRRRYMILA